MHKTTPFRTVLAASTALLMISAIEARADGERAGVATAVNPMASTIDGKGRGKLISLGDPVIRNHRIETSAQGLVQILLADGTAFTVGPNSSVVIDSFIYDPASKTASLSATMTKGALRFIGGRASKKGGDVKINTPIGTAGIRGAVVDINLNGTDAEGRALPPHMSLVYGKEVELTGRGRPQRLFKSGFSIIAEGAGTRVDRTPQAWVSGLQQYLAGRPDFNGGSVNRPTDQIVATSQVDNKNSAVSPDENRIPVPKPRPIANNTPDKLAGDSQRDTIRPVIPPTTPGTPPTTPPTPPTPTPPDVVRHDVTVLTGSGPGGTLRQSQGSFIEGDDGKASGSYGEAGRFTLPLLEGTSSLSKRHVTGSVEGLGTVSGAAYTGTGNFVAYLLENNQDQPFLVVGGKPASAVSTLASGEIMRYRLEPDALNELTNCFDVAVPFTDGDDNFSHRTKSSDLYVAGVTVDPVTGVIGRSLQASISIHGSGANQSSAINVFAGTVGLLAGGGYGLSGSIAGSHQLASGVSGRNQGLAETIGSTPGKDQFFGDNGEYLVIGSGKTDPASSSSETGFNGYDGVNVAGRTNKTTDKTRLYGSAPTAGFASGLSSDGSTATALVGHTDFSFDAAKGTVTGSISVGADGSAIGVELSQSDDTAYLSDQIMAATKKDGSYMVSSKVAPVKIFNGNTSTEICSSCDFMTWGWWGTGAPDDSGKSVHMGNWIVGQQATGTQIAGVTGTATYAGNAVGTVNNDGSQYIATGSMQASMNFGAREGNVSISNFDGKSFSQDVSFVEGTANFKGATDTGTRQTSIDGGFATDGVDPVKGVMGNFTATQGGWSASGVFAGSKPSTMPH
ncbi:FecR domain-containing protein [Peteryoungia ipomoeae]|uniref:FecR protein domain-containing protein n=1 Tax=Peteryoungia ipomoeae TaxID=1210932 RepID=A0A4V4HMQ0_9HYPH|nr:FecR domain-containing protein [Peteryoungia ipomoeae]THV23096.1 hypothetical protein FAA97_10815 [Peteryoungia ipomoeae]